MQLQSYKDLLTFSLRVFRDPVSAAQELRSNFWLNKDYWWTIVIANAVITAITQMAAAPINISTGKVTIADEAIGIVIGFVVRLLLMHLSVRYLLAPLLRVCYRMVGARFTADQARDIAFIGFVPGLVIFYAIPCAVVVIAVGGAAYFIHQYAAVAVGVITVLLVIYWGIKLTVNSFRFMKHFLGISYGQFFGAMLIPILLLMVMTIAVAGVVAAIKAT